MSGPSFTQGSTGKALLVCGDVEPKPGPCLGGWGGVTTDPDHARPTGPPDGGSGQLVAVGGTASLCVAAAAGGNPSLMRQGPIL